MGHGVVSVVGTWRTKLPQWFVDREDLCTVFMLSIIHTETQQVPCGLAEPIVMAMKQVYWIVNWLDWVKSQTLHVLLTRRILEWNVMQVVSLKIIFNKNALDILNIKYLFLFCLYIQDFLTFCNTLLHNVTLVILNLKLL